MSAPLSFGLVEACDSPDLFGLDLFPVQREILEAIEAGVEQQFVLTLGRRSGKTLLEAIVMVHACLLRPELRQYLRRRETLYCVSVATRLDQARLVVDAARSIVEESPLLAGMLKSANEFELKFKNGSCITAFPCSSRAGRGWPIAVLGLDELAHFHNDVDGPQAAKAVWESLVPGTSQFGRDRRVIVATTPNGEDTMHATLHRHAMAGEFGMRGFHHPTIEVNPTISRELLALEEARDPDSFRQEFGAELLGSGGAFLAMDRFNVQDREHALEPADLVPPLVLGIDPAFAGGRDEFGISITGRDPEDPRRIVLASVQGLQPRRVDSVEEQAEVRVEILRMVAATARRFGADVVTDQYCSRSVVEYLRREGLNVRVLSMTAQSKTQAYVEMRARLYSGNLLIYRDRELLDEMRRLRSRVAAGQSSVVYPRTGGSHGDRVQSLAIAVLAQSKLGGPLDGEARSGPWMAGRDDPLEGVPRLRNSPDGVGRQGEAPPRGWPGGETGWLDMQF